MGYETFEHGKAFHWEIPDKGRTRLGGSTSCRLILRRGRRLQQGPWVPGCNRGRCPTSKRLNSTPSYAYFIYFKVFHVCLCDAVLLMSFTTDQILPSVMRLVPP